MNMNPGNEVNLIIPPAVQADMEKRAILTEDIEKVVAHSQSTGQRFLNHDDHSYLADLRLENVTYWVRYKEKEDGIHVLTVYSHRMEIVKE